jgi:hypothetical protein
LHPLFEKAPKVLKKLATEKKEKKGEKKFGEKKKVITFAAPKTGREKTKESRCPGNRILKIQKVL